MYLDSEVPGGKNYPPEPLMILSHRGNPVDEERQSYWYLSSREKCICMLDGVTKPILEENNYAIIIGKLKQLSLFDNLPINYRHSYIYCRGIALQDILRIDYQGTPIRNENNRGKWSASEAVSDPYKSEKETYDAVYHYGCKWMCLVTGTTDEPQYGSASWAMVEGNPDFSIDKSEKETYDAVYHYGCKWMCLVTGTTDEPQYGSASWAMVEGNPDFSIDIESSNGWYFDAERFATTLTITGELYNRDVTAHVLDSDVEWTRDTGNVTEDNAWAVAHAETGKSLPLTVNDLGPDYMNMTGCKFIARVLLRDGQNNYETIWAMVEGNPDFSIDIESSNGWYFDAERFATTLTITGELYNRDVTAHVLDSDVEWTRDTGNVTEDNAWAVAHAETGKSLPLTVNDLGPDYMNMTGCKFIARVLLRDGQNNYETMNYITF